MCLLHYLIVYPNKQLKERFYDLLPFNLQFPCTFSIETVPQYIGVTLDRKLI